jgi:hypothetical protein
MLNWWMALGVRGKLVYWGVLGMIFNGVLLCMVDHWMPVVLFVSIGFFWPGAHNEESGLHGYMKMNLK